MTDQADQTIVIRYVLEAQDTITKAKEVDAQVLKIKTDLMSMSASSGASLKSLATAMQQTAKVDFNKQVADIKSMNLPIQQQTQLIQQVTAAYNQLTSSITKAQTAAQGGSSGVAQATTQAGTAAKNASGGFTALAAGIGAAFGLSAVMLVRNFFQAIISLSQEGIQAAYDFGKGLFQIQVGVNALRRAGTDITFSSVLAQLQKLKTEFGVFSMKDLVVGAGQFLNLNRDMGFTEDELYALQEAIATLAVVNGRSMDEVQKTVALALSSGYTEGLQRLGVSINRVTIAEEAAALGYAKSYMALTEVQRAEATRILILEKTAVYQKDLIEYQKTLTGQIDVATKSIEDQTVALGQNLLALKLWWAQVKLGATEKLTSFLTALNEPARQEFIAGMLKQQEESLGRILTKKEKIAMIDAARAAWEAGVTNGALSAQQIFEKYQIPSEKYNPNRVGEPGVTQKIEPPLTEDQITAVDSAAKQIIDIQTQYDIDRRDLAIDLERDLAQIEADGQDKLVEIDASHAQKMLDIASKASEAIRQASEKYALDVQQAGDDYYSNVAGAAEKHSNKLLKIEEDYQEKLKRLKEGFLMDLEGALEQRDARQVLKLIKQYNLEKTQATRERDQNLKEEERTYREQLNELDRQRADRLKKLKQEFDARNAELIRQRDRELALEVEAYTKKRIEQEHQNAVDRGEREQRYQEDLDDLALHLKDRIDALAKGLIEDAKITQTGMQNVFDIINTYVGPGGLTDQLYAYFVASTQAAFAAAMGATTALATGLNNMMFLPHTIPSSGTHAQGGIEVASKPTTAVFGDAGPEVALFLPLSKLLAGASNSKSELPTMKAGGKEGNGKAQIEILLGAGLEGRIIDQALNEVANITLRRVTR